MSCNIHSLAIMFDHFISELSYEQVLARILNPWTIGGLVIATIVPRLLSLLSQADSSLSWGKMKDVAHIAWMDPEF